MKINVGTLDRALRIVAGVALIVLGALGRVGPWAYVGIIPLATGVMRVCPAYSLLGWNTCSTRRS